MRARLPGAHKTPATGYPRRLVSVALILTLYPGLATQAFSGQPLAATLPFAVRTFLLCSVSRIAPAAVWQASPLDYHSSLHSGHEHHDHALALRRNSHSLRRTESTAPSR